MADKSWMLNPLAIRHARDCIAIIKRDFDVSLKLSDPDFLVQMQEKVALAASRDLGRAYALLVADAGVGGLHALDQQPAKPVIAAAR